MRLRRLPGAPPREGGFLDRLQANAERLVRIRPLAKPPGDIQPRPRAHRAAGIEADLPGALAELAKLPAPARAAGAAHGSPRRRRGLRGRGEAGRFAADAICGARQDATTR